MTYTKDDHLQDIAAYNKNNTVQIALRLNKKYDADIINKLDIVENKQGYIKTLIRNDIGKEKET